MKTQYEKYQEYMNKAAGQFRIDSSDLKNLHEIFHIINTPETLSILKKIFLNEWFIGFQRRIDKIITYKDYNSEFNEQGITVGQSNQNP